MQVIRLDDGTITNAESNYPSEGKLIPPHNTEYPHFVKNKPAGQKGFQDGHH